MAQRRDFEKAGRIAKVKKADYDRYQEKVFGKEPKARGNTSAVKKLTKNERIMQAYFKIMRKQREQTKRAAEERMRQEKEQKKQQKEAQRRLNGEKAADLLFTAIHSGRIDYGKVLSEDWCFNSEREAVYFNQKVEEPVHAEKSEYLCLGFPKKLVEQLECEIRSHLQKTPHAIIRVERILIDRLSQISRRQCWKRVSESTIRQVFQINKKALKRAQKCWPEIYQIVKETS
jgi:hypothetical protein